ncbi:MAG: hypothetical protein IK044_05435 [Methanobrevibacter sp.]|nr:hypothetical protein [Methanobrevibacter sp.]
MELWNKEQEKQFFYNSKNFASINQLFNETEDGRYVAYWPRNYKGKKTTLQSRNSLIGKYSEKWVSDVLNHLIKDKNLFVVQQAQIPAIGISHNSPADVVIASKNEKVLRPEDVKIIFEVKMSIVWNWEYDVSTDRLFEIGDYRSHRGKPSFTRSDSILKAIGKCVDIRVSNVLASKIPLIVLGNAPLSNGFCKKADYLKNAGIIQGFWSLNPFPLNHGNSRKITPKKGFIRFDDVDELDMNLNDLFSENLNFFSGMKNPAQLGKIIEMANNENNYHNKGLKFLKLINGS